MMRQKLRRINEKEVQDVRRLFPIVCILHASAVAVHTERKKYAALFLHENCTTYIGV